MTTDAGRVRVRRGFRRVAVAIVVVLLPVAAWNLWDYIEARRLAGLVDEIKRRGEPVEVPAEKFGDFERPENAAPYYDAAAAILDRRELYGSTGINSTLYHRPQDRVTAMTRVREWLQQNAEAERLLDIATDREFMGFRPGSRDSLSSDRMSGLARLAALRAAERADAGDGNSAARAMYVQLRVARTMQPEAWTSDFAAYSVERALQEIGPVLEANAGEQALDRLQQAIVAQDRDAGIEASALQLRAQLIASMWDHSRDWYGRPRVRFNADRPIDPLIYHVSRPWFAHRLNGEIKVMNRAVEQARKAWPERLHFEGPDAPPRPPGRFLGIFSLDYPAGVLRYLNHHRARGLGRMLAYVRTSAPAIALMRYRAAHGGALPATLDALVPGYLPKVPVDPFSGHPVRFKALGDGFVVYSLGANETDEGGTTRIEEKQRVANARSSRDPLDYGVHVRLTAPR